MRLMGVGSVDKERTVLRTDDERYLDFYGIVGYLDSAFFAAGPRIQDPACHERRGECEAMP